MPGVPQYDAAPQASPRPYVERTRVSLRKIPGALALGLLASLVAHTALYGGGHAMGGAYHELLLEAAAAGSIGLLTLLGALAWLGARRASDGSILAARLGAHVPNLYAVAASAAGCFALAEWVEKPHAGGGVLPAAGCLLLAAWLVLTLARAAVRALAGAVVAIVAGAFDRRPLPVRIARRDPAPRALRSPLLRRRFARPPPIANARA